MLVIKNGGGKIYARYYYYRIEWIYELQLELNILGHTLEIVEGSE